MKKLYLGITFVGLKDSENSILGKYLSLIKFSHTVFALPFALVGFFLAIQYNSRQSIDDVHIVNSYTPVQGYSTWYLLLLVMLCMVFARNAAMAFNRYIDEKFDKQNARTASREIPSGKISKKNAGLFVLLNCLLFILSTFFINSICFYLSPVALFIILFYSYTKRFTALCHLVLGLGLSLAPIGAYLAVRGEMAKEPLFFSLVVFTWVSGFDILYALQDEEFDKSINLKSIPVLLGRTNALMVSKLLHICTAATVIYIGVIAHFGLIYWIGALIFIAMLVYQHSLVKPNDISKVNLAFATANGIASVVFGTSVTLDLFL